MPRGATVRCHPPPILTDVSIEWNGMPVAEIYPPDAGSVHRKPVIVNGRYTAAHKGDPPQGHASRQPFTTRSRSLSGDERRTTCCHPVARTKIEHDVAGLARHAERHSDGDLSSRSPELGLNYRLMTQFLRLWPSEEMTITKAAAEDGAGNGIECPDA